MLCLFASSTHLIASAERRGGAETESVESGRLRSHILGAERNRHQKHFIARHSTSIC